MLSEPRITQIAQMGYDGHLLTPSSRRGVFCRPVHPAPGIHCVRCVARPLRFAKGTGDRVGRLYVMWVLFVEVTVLCERRFAPKEGGFETRLYQGRRASP